jgi:monothiol glutaredoxin
VALAQPLRRPSPEFQMPSRPQLVTAHVSESALTAMESFHADIVREVSQAVQRDAIVVVGMRMNPVVKQARKALAEAGLQYTYLEYGSYLSEWKRRLAIKLWSGWPTFPQVYVRGVLLGGNKELRLALGDGTVKARLATPQAAA